MPYIAKFRDDKLYDLDGRELDPSSVTVTVDPMRQQSVVVLYCYEPVLIVSNRPPTVWELTRTYKLYPTKVENALAFRAQVYPTREAALEALRLACEEFATVFAQKSYADIIMKIAE